MQLLLVEDDRDLAEFVQEGLTREGFAVDVARDGREALRKAENHLYDIVLLDVMMPQLDGLSVLKKLRSGGQRVGILLVTSKGQEQDKLEGLNCGADDYLVKPYLLSELIARIRAVLRRTGQIAKTTAAASILKHKDIQMDLLKHEVKRGKKLITLTKKEFELLEYLLRHPGRVFSQTVLAQKLTQDDCASSTNFVEVHIKNLRFKLDGKSGMSLIRTVRGCGYGLAI